MRSALWDAANPCGNLYNPVSIARIIELSLIEDDALAVGEFETSVFENRLGWNSWLLDSRFTAANREELIEGFRSLRHLMRQRLEASQALCVTFGTAWVYELAEAADPRNRNAVVGNCHKCPASLFIRSRLSVSEIASIWTDLLKRLGERFPQLRFIFTVSPVRHLKDGFEGNARSKSILLLAIEEITRISNAASYFPAYEIMLDDLRDYRFYASDLAHPSAEGVEYIWQKFCETYIDAPGREILEEGESIVRALSHRPIVDFTPKGAEALRHQQQSATRRLKDFLTLHPRMLNPIIPSTDRI